MSGGNPNLTSGQMLPGFYGYVDYAGAGISGQSLNEALLVAYVPAAASQQLNRPFRPADETDCANRCGGTNNDLTRGYRAALAQPDAAGADIWCLPLAEPAAGTQATYTLQIFVSDTNPAKAGSINMWIASLPVPAVGFSMSDTATTIASALAEAISSMANAPCTATSSNGILTLTYVHKGTTGEDLPIRAQVVPNGSGVQISCGTAVFATAAIGAGSVVVTVGSISVSTVLAGGETPSQVAAKVAASFAADSYPVTAAVDATTNTNVDFFLAPGFDVRRMSASVVTTTGTTVNLGSGVTSGAGSASSLTYNGAQGTGAPSVVSALANLASMPQWFRAIAIPFTDTATVGAFATNLEAAGNGSITGQKFQTLTLCDWRSITVAGGIAPATSPNLTSTTPRYAIGWSPDASVQAFELSARVAAARAAKWLGSPSYNWNGYKLLGNGGAPLLAPASTPDPDTLNSALRTYALSPWTLGASGNVEIVKGRTTSLSVDLRLWSWSCESQASYHIVDLQTYFPQVFRKPDGSAASLVRFSDPKAPGIFDAQSFTDVTRDRMHLWEQQGNYDGADLLSPAVTSTPDSVNVGRINTEFPESPVLDLDQVVFTGHVSQPSA